MADSSPPTTVPKQQLIELINQDNDGLGLTLADVTLSDPVAGTYSFPQGTRNTKVTVTAIDGSDFSGTENVYYNRLSLSDLGAVGIVTATPLTSDELLQIVSTRKGVDLLADEFETIIIPVLEVGVQGAVVLVAKATAIKWYGQLQVDYAFSLPPEMSILHQLIHVTLPGYNWLG